MKIAMIIDAWDPIVWWWQIHVYNLCRKLIENHGCKIDLFVRAIAWDDGKIYDKDETLFGGKMRILRCWRPKKFFNTFERVLSIFSIYFRIKQEHKRQKYDFIHAHAFLWLLSGKIASFFLKIPIVATVHGSNLMDRWKRSFYYYIEKKLLTGIAYDKLISVGSSFLKYKNINDNISIIPNGINISDFTNVDISKRNDIFKILFVWRLEWTKGIDVFINAIDIIRKSDVWLMDDMHVQCHLIWYWYQENDYKLMVKEKNLSKYIIFRWLVTGVELIREYKESKLFVLPSRTEWFGITILEAMASNVPVIATRCWGPEDIIQNWLNGVLIEKENSYALAKEILYFIKWKIDIDKMINRWYELVKKNFTWDIVAQKTFQIYLTVC